MRIATAIVTMPARLALAEDLARQIDPTPELIVDPGLGLVGNHIAAWGYLAERDADWCVLFQDDITLCADFPAVLRSWLRRAADDGAKVVSLFSTRPDAAEAMLAGKRWWVCAGGSFLWEQGLAMPPATARRYLAAVDSGQIEKTQKTGHDYMLQRFFAAEGLSVYVALPNPIDHRYDVPSTVGHPQNRRSSSTFGKTEMYGQAGSRWPIAHGDVIEVGPHRFVCADLESPQYNRIWRFLPAFHTVYTDLPWNLAQCNRFRRIAGLPGKADFPHLMGAIVRHATRYTGPLWMEMGERHSAQLAALLGRVTGWSPQTWDITYNRRHPAKLIRCGAEPTALDFTGMDDLDTPALALSETPLGSVVFDPCTGQGLTAVTADRLGLVAIGTELHPRRLSVTVDRLIRQGGYAFRKIGRL